MNYSLNVKSSSIVHTLLSNCVKLLGKVQKLLIKCISYSVISKRIRVVSPKFYTARKNFTGPPVPTVPTNFKSGIHQPRWFYQIQISSLQTNKLQPYQHRGDGFIRSRFHHYRQTNHNHINTEEMNTPDTTTNSRHK